MGLRTQTGLGTALSCRCNVTFLFRVLQLFVLLYHRKRWENQAGMGLRTKAGLGTAPLLLQCYVSFLGTPVVLLYHWKRWENQAGMGLRTKTGLGMALLLLQCYVSFMALKLYCCTTGNDGKIEQEWVYEHKHKNLRDFSILSLSLSLSVFLSLLTCVVLVPLEDRSKHLGQFIEHCAQHEHDDSCCFHPLEHSLAIGRRSGALPPSKMSHRTRERTALSAVCHGPANIQATSSVAYDLWYGVRSPCVPVLYRFGKSSKTWKLTAPTFWAPSSSHFF